MDLVDRMVFKRDLTNSALLYYGMGGVGKDRANPTSIVKALNVFKEPHKVELSPSLRMPRNLTSN